MVTKLLAVLAIAATAVASQVLAGSSTGSQTFKAQTFKVVVGGETFALAEVDVGVRFDCGPGRMVGVVLKDSQGIARWSFNLADTAAFLAVHGCSGISAANVVGVAVPSKDTAVWVVQVLACGMSCAGYDVHVFSFHPLRKSFTNSIEYDSVTVPDEIQREVGEGAVKFAFPRLVLYVSHGYHECPSRWTRTTYEWTQTSSTISKFVVKSEMSYTSPQCALSNPRYWPPDPGQ